MAEAMASTTSSGIPSTIFIVPYRNREAHLSLYLRHMPWILETSDISQSYEVIIAHQADGRSFNRGAMKNLGFIVARQLYPYHYKNITFVFQDVDTLPGMRNIMAFKTSFGEVHHYYGFNFALGGIFSIKGADFERINGFPNYWGWGFEDNALQMRWAKVGGKTIRDEQYYPPADLRILQFGSGNQRVLDSFITHKLAADNGSDGISSISRINWNKTELQSKHIMVNFTSWEVPESEEEVRFETRTAPRYVVQPSISMNNILHTSQVHSMKTRTRRR